MFIVPFAHRLGAKSESVPGELVVQKPVSSKIRKRRQCKLLSQIKSAVDGAYDVAKPRGA